MFMKKVALMNVNFSVDELNITESKDPVVATYRTTFEGVSNGSKMKIHAIETIVFRLEEDKWKILHLHTTNATLL